MYIIIFTPLDNPRCLHSVPCSRSHTEEVVEVGFKPGKNTVKHTEKKAMWRRRQRLEFCLQTKEYMGSSEFEQGKEGFFLRAIGGTVTLTSPWFRASCLQKCKRISSYCFKTSSL